MYVNPVMAQMPNAITKRGGIVFFVDGAGSRGAGGLGMASSLYAMMCHWIVSPNLPQNANRNMTLGIVVNGHAGLAGPLANYYLRGDGAIGIVAFGRANHGGVGSWRGISGNQFHAGVEAEGPPFHAAQIRAYQIILAAWFDCTGRHPREWGIGHHEYAPTRKIDVKPYIDEIRNGAIHLVDNKIFANNQEDDMYDADARYEVVERLDRIIGGINAILPTVAQIQTGVMDKETGVRTLVLKLLADQSEQSGVTAEEIAAALPEGIAEGVADALARRLSRPVEGA